MLIQMRFLFACLPSLYVANGVSDDRLAHLVLHQLGCQAKCGKPPKSLGTLSGTSENVPDGCFTWMVVRQKYNCANLGGKGGAPCLPHFLRPREDWSNWCSHLDHFNSYVSERGKATSWLKPCPSLMRWHLATSFWYPSLASHSLCSRINLFGPLYAGSGSS